MTQFDEAARKASNKLQFRDNLGWPIERIIGRPITNFLRVLIHTNIRKTWTMRNHKDMPPQPDGIVCCEMKGGTDDLDA